MMGKKKIKINPTRIPRREEGEMPRRLPCSAGARGTAGGWRRDSPALAGAARASPGSARPPKPRREVCAGRSFPGRALLYIPGSTSPPPPARRGLGVEKPRQRHLPASPPPPPELTSHRPSGAASGCAGGRGWGGRQGSAGGAGGAEERRRGGDKSRARAALAPL